MPAPTTTIAGSDTTAPFDAGAEFDRQVSNLLDLGYPPLIGTDPATLTAMLEPLRAVVLARQDTMTAPARARVPFVLVISRHLAKPGQSMLLTSRAGKPGFVSADTVDIDRFEPVAALDIPEGDAYVAFDVDRGKDTRNVSPDNAVIALTARGRTPMTIEEGIALITAFPESLEENNCFQLAGSRCGDRRVPGLWISNRQPKLGFCWAGNTHTWLGAASCTGRAGAATPSR